MACAPYAAGMSELMAARAEATGSDALAQLHLVYLANDILFKAQAQRNPGAATASSDPIAGAMLPSLRRMLRAADASAGAPAPAQQQ